MKYLLLLALVACNDSKETGNSDTSSPYDPSGWPLGEIEKTDGRGILANYEIQEGNIQILRVSGDYYEMGRQMGSLVGEQIPPIWDSFKQALAEELDMSDTVVETLYVPILDQVWLHLASHTPKKHMDMMRGLNDAMGTPIEEDGSFDSDNPCLTCRIVAISNLSDLNFNDITSALNTAQNGTSEQLDTYYSQGPDAQLAPRSLNGTAPFQTCSFFAAWGSRTEQNHMIASRNLDWTNDTGIHENRLITIFKPIGPDAGHPYATIGYAGMPGGLAGISSTGIAVAEVGSTGVLERIKGEPWVFRHLDILEHAKTLEEAILFHTNQANSGNYPQTIGYNFMVAFGDPENNGNSSDAAVIEANGAMVSVVKNGVTDVHFFAENGEHLQTITGNKEEEAKEINSQGETRLFIEDSGQYIEDPSGTPIYTGFPLSEAIFRGDEALSHTNRQYQIASHGPQNSEDLLITSSSYKNRYLRSRNMLEAWELGTSYYLDDTELIPDNEGQKTLIGLDEGVTLTAAVGMSSNIMSIVYDATGLEVMVSYESGSGDSWKAAKENPYLYIDLKDAFDFK